MPTHLNLRYAEIESLWPGVEALQGLADEYGIKDVFQDAGGKMLQLAIATGLDLVPGRTGPDARDRIGNLYEVKTVDMAGKKSGGFTTNHHMTKDTIARYRNRRWVFATYDRITLMEAYLVEAEDLEPIFRKWEHDLRVKDHLNNPKIPVDFVREIGTPMYLKDVPPPWAVRATTGVTENDISSGVSA
ncbi:type-2 restriction enzyme [Bacteriophage DSS3_MAL1]|nr:type-2 restriction enzyme [Bacteriophage DSS3_MAL1]